MKSLSLQPKPSMNSAPNSKLISNPRSWTKVPLVLLFDTDIIKMLIYSPKGEESRVRAIQPIINQITGDHLILQIFGQREIALFERKKSLFLFINKTENAVFTFTLPALHIRLNCCKGQRRMLNVMPSNAENFQNAMVNARECSVMLSYQKVEKAYTC